MAAAHGSQGVCAGVFSTLAEPLPGYSATLKEEGVAVLPVGLEPAMVSRLLGAIATLEAGEGVRRRVDVYAVHNLIALAPEVLEALKVPLVRSLVESSLGPRFFAVGSSSTRLPEPTGGWRGTRISRSQSGDVLTCRVSALGR